ncbi:hypothetical protein NA57DRAFT_70367 [Rhizodiscina lignyota]|uniref:Cupin type-2 domain-containing protein n=1 Tax=Rhizodiscina lignyota TaxID=1504668 RepID=A0A9P4MG43_9PEZI|nr:hypothetical protein NA57DRAFT_70367 [Rhizodiscina lignyota]
MLSFLAGGHPPRRSNTAAQSKVYYEDGRASQEFHSLAENSRYGVTHVIPKAGIPSAFNPPLHFHAVQVETLTVREGVGHFFLNTETCMVPDASKPTVINAGETIVIPMGAYHRFENPDPDNVMVLQIALDPDLRDAEHSFFRNFLGYIDDCKKGKMEPSIFQLLLFLYASSTPLAVPIPSPFIPAFVGRAVSWALVYVGGVLIGELLLGYKGSYDEYFKKETE